MLLLVFLIGRSCLYCFEFLPLLQKHVYIVSVAFFCFMLPSLTWRQCIGVKVDFSGNVEDDVLQSLGLQKGARKVIGDEEIVDVFETVNYHDSAVAAGGSLSNTLLALARLGMRSNGQPSIKVAMSAAVGNDKHGKLYREELEKENVNFVSQPIKNGSTGTVIVLTTPDAQRTMLSYQVTC